MNMLSKSVGDLSNSDLLDLKRRHPAPIKYSGYLLKRSNAPCFSELTSPPVAMRNSNASTLEPSLNDLGTGLAPPTTTTRSRSFNTTTNWLRNSNSTPTDGPHILPPMIDPNTNTGTGTGIGLSMLIPPQPTAPLHGGEGINASNGGGMNKNFYNSQNKKSLSIPDLTMGQSSIEEAAGSLAELFGQDPSSCYNKSSPTQQQQSNIYRSFDGEQSTESVGSNSFQNYSLNAKSSESSHIPLLPKSRTQPIAIASTHSEDSEDYFNYYNKNSNYNTSNIHSRQPIKSGDRRNYHLPNLSNVPRPPAYVRMTSEPVVGSNISYPPPPEDYIDKNDRHIWRAQYCVLEDGILYFYTDAETGNLPAAQQERSMSGMSNLDYNRQGYSEDNYMYSNNQNNKNNIPSTAININNVKKDSYDYGHLAKSPMPRRSLMELNSETKEINGRENSNHGTDFFWVKRVALNMVGNVRSNPDYGKRVFELLAINSEEKSDENGGALDRLLLRATSEDDMNDWIFHIHRSFISLMKQIAEIVGSVEPSIRDSDGLIESERMSSKIFIDNCGKNSSPLAPVLGHSPFNESSLKSGCGALSHGHGRSIRHRRSEKGENFIESSSTHLDASPTHYSIDMKKSRLRSQSFEEPQNFGETPEALSEGDMSEIMLYSPSPLSWNFHGQMPNYPNDAPPTTAMAIPSITNSSLSGHTISSQKYIPPQKRKEYNNNPNLDKATADALAEQVRSEEEFFYPCDDFHDEITTEMQEEQIEVVNVALGGCADPTLIEGSICDEEFVKEKASNVKESADGPFACRTDHLEIGATSTRGVRDSNEDSYLIVNDLLDGSSVAVKDSFFSFFSKQRSLFAIFDGHCGNHAARFAAEKLRDILVEESIGIERDDDGQNDDPKIRKILNAAISRLDKEFCELCLKDGRQWYSGSTAIIAIFLNEKLFVANVGDCEGIICCSSQQYTTEQKNDWKILQVEKSESLEKKESNHAHLSEENSEIIWREVAKVHSPSQEEEKKRIESANGWTVNSEKEVVIASQFQTIRENLTDEDVRLMFLHWFSDPPDSKHTRIYNVWRVCGDLSVSRAIGDFEYKAAYGIRNDDNGWKSAAPFFYPTSHNHIFTDDLITSTPDINSYKVIGDEKVLLLACDGFWDVLDADDAVRLTRRLIFERGLSAWESTWRLAKLARCLGSSDNITVIIVRF